MGQMIDGYWNDMERDQRSVADPYARAAEILARDVERYLHRSHNHDGTPWPGHRNEDFLSWAVARYDACKNGSGQPYHNADYDFSAPHDNVLPGHTPAQLETAPAVEGDDD